MEKYLESYNVKIKTLSPVFIGGGAGYLSKTVTYPLLGREDGLKVAKKILPKSEEEDMLAPRVMKMTRYNNQLYHLGMCELNIM